MNISEAAKRAGLPAKTIRYYEEIGLVAPQRDPNGYRAFQPRDLHALTFVARARSLGFSIEDCRALLHLYQDPTRASADVKDIARSHLGRIDAKLVELAAMRNTLTDLIEACAGDQRPDCPILKGLAPNRLTAGEGIATRVSQRIPSDADRPSRADDDDPGI